jgi:hypothetical protein
MLRDGIEVLEMAKKNKTTPAPIEKGIKVNIKLEAKPDTPFYYANCISVAHSAFDFIIGAARIPVPLSPEQMEGAKKGNPIILEPTLQLVVAPWVAKNLIDALTDQVAKYEEQFGKINTQMPNNEKNE